MEKVFKYKSNKKLNSYKIAINLRKFIDKTVEKGCINKLILNFSQITKIPSKIISDESKQILFSEFWFTPGKFTKKFALKYIFRDSFIYLALLLFFIFFSKKNINRENYNIIIEDIEEEGQLERFSKISNLSKKSVFICRKKIKIKQKNIKKFNIKFFPILKFYNSEFLKGKKLNLFIFFFSLFYHSIKYKTNLFFFFSKIFYRIVNYETIFSQINSKALLIDRFYKTSAIRNHIFKKNGGMVTACFQKNICEFTISFYIYIDVFFSLGKEVPKICNELGGQIKKFVPVGSLFMENAWYNKKKDLSKIPDIDILFAGSSHTHAPNRLYIDRHHYKNYYDQIHWTRKISDFFPKYNIILKHHDPYKGDEKEDQIFNGSSIKVVFKSESINSSYAYLYKAKQTYAFVSTLILEGLSMGKKCFFIDPNFQNIAFFKNLKRTKNLRMGSFNQLKKNVIKNSKKSRKIKIKNTDFYCLKSDKVSERAINFFKKNKYF